MRNGMPPARNPTPQAQLKVDAHAQPKAGTSPAPASLYVRLVLWLIRPALVRHAQESASLAEPAEGARDAYLDGLLEPISAAQVKTQAPDSPLAATAADSELQRLLSIDGVRQC